MNVTCGFKHNFGANKAKILIIFTKSSKIARPPPASASKQEITRREPFS